MSSMTVDQLKKSLTEQGVTLPSSRLKKADYVKLYKQHSTLNDSLGDVYSSDDDNPPSKTGSHSVSSSTSPGKVEKEIEQLTDDELYLRLKEFEPNIGPVLKNTRRVYEKKLMKMLNSGKQSNGYDVKTHSERTIPSDEYSDSDIEVISQSLKTEGKGRKSSVLRDSPKPSSSVISKADVEKPFSSNFEYSTTRSSTPNYTNKVTLPSRYSYIETVPKKSSVGYLENESDDNFSSDLRQRFTDRYDIDKFSSDKFSSDKYGTNKTFDEDTYKPSIDIGNQLKSNFGSYYKGSLVGGDKYKSGLGPTGQYKSSLGIGNRYKPSGSGLGDHYTGTWEPNINRYLGSTTQRRIVSKSHNYSAVLKYFFITLFLLVLLIAAIYLYKHWPATDPYKMLEDDAERTIESLTEGSGGY